MNTNKIRNFFHFTSIEHKGTGLFCILFFCNTLLFAAVNNLTDTAPIKVGKTGSESGQDAPVGQNMTLGVKIYFDKINAEGGIGGRKLQLISMDDGYDPIRAGKNARQLVDKDQVLALIGDNGSPTTVVVKPILADKKTLLFAPFPGSDFLYKNQRYVITLRPSYAAEVKKMIKELAGAGIKPNEIAFFTQNDTFGDSVHTGGMESLKEIGYAHPEGLPHGRYTRNTLNVEDALTTILEQAKIPPKVFIMGGVSSANAKFVQLAKKQFPNAIYIAVSGFFSEKDFGHDDEGKVMTTLVVPSYEANLATTKEYLQDLEKYGAGAKPSFTSLQAYVAAKVFVLGIKQALAENKLTREGIIDVFDSMHNVDIGIGVPLNFDKAHNPGLNTVWITILKNGKFAQLDWSELRSIINRTNAPH